MTFALDLAVPHAGEIYRHWSGTYVAVICLVQHLETGDLMVVYQNLDTTQRWTMTLETWSTAVKVPTTEGLVPLFTLMPEDLSIPVPLVCNVTRQGKYEVVP